MGFTDLVLVAPRWANVLRREETIQRASGALDVLANAKIVDSLDEALDGITHLCATAMIPRDFGPPTRTPRAHFATLTAPATQTGSGADHGDMPHNPTHPHAVAFLFGSERFGMRNEDVYRCHVALQIPSNPEFGSLNLASALQLVAYEWRLALGGFTAAETSNSTTTPVLADQQNNPASAVHVSGMLAHLEEALVQIGFLDPQSPKKLMPRLNTLFNRSNMTQEEIHILRGISKAILQYAKPK